MRADKFKLCAGMRVHFQPEDIWIVWYVPGDRPNGEFEAYRENDPEKTRVTFLERHIGGVLPGRVDI